MRPLCRVGLVVLLGVAAVGWAGAAVLFIVVGASIVLGLAAFAWTFWGETDAWAPLAAAAFFALAATAVFPMWLRFGRALWWQIADAVAGRKGSAREWWAACQQPLTAPRRGRGGAAVRRERQPDRPGRLSGGALARRMIPGLFSISLVFPVGLYALALLVRAVSYHAPWRSVGGAVSVVLAGVASLCATTPWRSKVRRWGSLGLWRFTACLWLLLAWWLARPVSLASGVGLVVLWTVMAALARRSEKGGQH